jgi:hypothetical protein
MRHWFTVWGYTGLRSPVCMNCSAPNPRPLSDAEWAELTVIRDQRGGPWPNPELEQAIGARQAAIRTAERKVRDILQEIREQGAG